MRTIIILIINLILILVSSIILASIIGWILDINIFYLIIILFGAGIILLKPYITYNVALFRVHIVLDALTSRKRVIFEGFVFKLPWENISEPEEIDLTAEIVSKIRDNYTVKGGTVEVEFNLVSKANFEPDNDKSKQQKVLNYATFKKSEKEKMQEGKGRQLVREAVKDKTPEEAKNLKETDVFPEGSFDEIAKKLDVKFIKIQLIDIDFDKDTKKLNDSEFRAALLVKVKNKLVSEGNFNEKFAEELTQYAVDGMNIKKDVKEIKINDLDKIADSIISKFKK